jgi:hypothetical protein
MMFCSLQKSRFSVNPPRKCINLHPVSNISSLSLNNPNIEFIQFIRCMCTVESWKLYSRSSFYLSKPNFDDG